MNQLTKYRILEILPGLSLWLTFFIAIILSFVKPIWLVYFIILFDLYWFLRITYFVTYLFISFWRYKNAIKVDWLALVKAREDWSSYYHLIILPVYKEGREVFETTFKALSSSTYPLDKMIVVVSGEERGYPENFLSTAEFIQNRYGHLFKKFIVTIHPDNLPGELRGKGANGTWAAKKGVQEIDNLGIPYEKVIVSNFDFDTCINPQYFAYLTYQYLSQEDPTRCSYQPLAFYNNNIWDAPAFARVVANSTTFWLMAELARPERLFTFSSHSMSLQALVEVGYWETNIVTEDSRIFLQCFDHYDGDYRVVPMYISVSMDTVLGENVWGTIKNQYKQMRRWAYSVEHFPWMVMHFAHNKKISWKKKFKYLFNQTEGQYSWGTAPLLILIAGWLPFLVGASYGEPAVIFQNTPIILDTLMSLSMVGVFISAFLNVLFLPAKPPRYGWYKYPAMILQWILLPVTMIAFGSLPCIDAQTRLMLGKYLGFDVTQKFRK